MPRPRRARFAEADPADDLVREVQSISLPLYGWEDLDPLMDRIGEARYVLLGEATHGTAEFYDWRRTISQRLIREHGFSFIAVEGDWPDCYRVNRYVKGFSEGGASAREVLHNFQRWPTWMWANDEVAVLAEWLRSHNRSLPEERKAGFYGLDVYSLWESMSAVLQYIERADGSAAAAVRRAFECFEPYAYEINEYARASAWISDTCEDEVIEMLRTLREHPAAYDASERDAYFNAEQNALVAKNAERYYRTMIRNDASSWNIRDTHMAEALDRLMAHHGPECKAIVWAHNTHVGDARYTDMAAEGMINLGQMVRQQHARQDVVLVGFSSHHGTVVAGDEWGAPMRTMVVPPGRPGSWEDVLHRAAPGDRLLLFDASRASQLVLEPRGHRAIGVVYRPQYEAFGNYVPTVMARRYDALVFLDETRAVHPLRVPAGFEHEVPETFPTGV
jgi:erythromycin esterase-like protein